MRGPGEELLADIDHTLDQMIENAVALRQIAEYEALTPNCAALHKVQTSLTGRLLHRQEFLQILGQDDLKNEEALRASIVEKISLYKRLNNTMIDTIAQRFTAMEQRKPAKRKPRIGHNRRKAPVRVA